MHRIAIAVSILALVACGSSESTKSGEDAGGAPVSASAPADEAAAVEPMEVVAEEVETEVVETASGDVVTDTVGCIELVGTGRFGEAVTVCMEELSIDPENTEIQTALAKAQAGQVDGGAAAAEAAGQASGALEGAAGAIPGGLPD